MTSGQDHHAAPVWIASSRLWLVLDRHAAAPRSLARTAALAIDGGVDVVLFRVKDLPAAEYRPLALEVNQVCLAHRTPLVISHDLDLARALNVAGVQIGAADAPVEELRRMTGPGMALGYSAHTVLEARAALAAGADYAFLGPLFPTPEKLKYGAPIGVQVVAEAVRLPGPVVFIGGINHSNIDEVVAAGGRRIAAISALQRTDDPTQAARELAAKLAG